MHSALTMSNEDVAMNGDIQVVVEFEEDCDAILGVTCNVNLHMHFVSYTWICHPGI